jgi:Rod binding domain-containing protein
MKPVTAPGPVPVQNAQAPARATREAAQAFEAQMLGAMLQPMFQGLDTKGPFSGGAAEAQWRPMLVEEYGRILARSGGVGIADSVLRQLREMPK